MLLIALTLCAFIGGTLGAKTFYQCVSLGLIAGMVGQWWVQHRQELTNNRAAAIQG